MNLLLRFVIGGFVVCAFSALGDLFQPKSFGGLFGAAPSVALATLALTVHSRGVSFASVESRSMAAGGISFLLYAVTCLHLIARYDMSVLKATIVSLLPWFASAIGLWFALSR